LKLLAIETSTEACSVAIEFDGDRRQVYEIAPRQHAELILPMVDGLLSEAGIPLQALDGLAFGRGPGSFTGVRIATGVIQGLAYAANLPVAPVSTLAAMAQGVSDRAEKIACAIDARMGEVYWGLYQQGENNCMQIQGQERVCHPDKVDLPDSNDWYGAGSGWGTYADELGTQFGEKLLGKDSGIYPSAEGVLTLALALFKNGGTVTAAEALPVYLRDKVTQ
jgi:tRNA threonylcarbamoyladenosine biosynthesis protein TsaB